MISLMKAPMKALLFYHHGMGVSTARKMRAVLNDTKWGL